jgi:hypothetical protein
MRRSCSRWDCIGLDHSIQHAPHQRHSIIEISGQDPKYFFCIFINEFKRHDSTQPPLIRLGSGIMQHNGRAMSCRRFGDAGCSPSGEVRTLNHEVHVVIGIKTFTGSGCLRQAKHTANTKQYEWKLEHLPPQKYRDLCIGVPTYAAGVNVYTHTCLWCHKDRIKCQTMAQTTKTIWYCDQVKLCKAKYWW